MSRRSTVAVAIAVGLLAAPAVAKPPPALIWVDYHFTDSKGRDHVATERVQIVRADYAAKACGEDLHKHGAAEASYELTKHPQFAGMTFAGANCEMDKAGQIKVVVATPTGGN